MKTPEISQKNQGHTLIGTAEHSAGAGAWTEGPPHVHDGQEGQGGQDPHVRDGAAGQAGTVGQGGALGHRLK